ncbi:MAG: hypothetical protein KF832_06495 [Caldilineaceae bacterium]|nr:hypothetical protein [Caldilineaceae bacterium]
MSSQFYSSPIVSKTTATRLVLIMGLLIFGAWPLARLTGWLLPQLLVPAGIWNFLVSWLLLGQSLGYLLMIVTMVGLSLVALFYERPSWWQRLFVGSVMGALLWFVFAPYVPAVQPAQGYQMVVVTEPFPWLRGLARAQAMGEQKVCTYQVLGWQATSLFYRADCGTEQGHIWQFTAGEMARPELYTGALPTLMQDSLSQTETWETVQAFATRPSHSDLRSLYVPKPGVRSPDGKWVAMVASYLYSREDVLLVAK